MQERFIIHIHTETDQWFFSTDHCQEGLSDDWVPVTYYGPTWNLERVIEFNNADLMIANPNPEYQPKENYA